MQDSNPSIERAQAGIVDVVPEEKVSEQEEVRQLRSNLARIHLEESLYLSNSRKQWSRFLGICIGLSIVFQFMLTYMVGAGKLNFEKYGSFLSVVAGGTFIQIVGLATIVLKWVFGGKRPDEMLQDENKR